MKAAQQSFVFPLSWRHKLSALQNGFISNDTFWDRLSFVSGRTAVLGRASNTLKNVVVNGEKASLFTRSPLTGVILGPLDASALTSIRIALSVPFSHVYTDPSVAGPVMSSHMLDLQSFPAIETTSASAQGVFGPLAHVGPPTINVEVKLVGVDDASVEAGASPVGEVRRRYTWSCSTACSIYILYLDRCSRTVCRPYR